MPYRQLEIDLARRIQTGDEEAFDEFARLFGSRLLHYSMTICRQREDAEEVVQDTLLRLHDRVSDLRDAERVRPWAFRVAKNVCLMKRRRKPLDRDHCFLVHPEAGTQMFPRQMELLEAVRDALSRLPKSLRLVFLLRAVEGLSTEETAEALEISVDAVKNRMRRARKTIREWIASPAVPASGSFCL